MCACCCWLLLLGTTGEQQRRREQVSEEHGSGEFNGPHRQMSTSTRSQGQVFMVATCTSFLITKCTHCLKQADCRGYLDVNAGAIVCFFGSCSDVCAVCSMFKRLPRQRAPPRTARALEGAASTRANRTRGELWKQMGRMGRTGKEQQCLRLPAVKRQLMSSGESKSGE